MRSDNSRDSFQALAGFSRVIEQQGRVQLDADANERQAIQLHFLRTLAADLIGPHAGVGNAFEISADEGMRYNFMVGAGRYYVDGWPCENPQPASYRPGEGLHAQPWSGPKDQPDDGVNCIVYLEVWERHLAAVEHDYLLARATPGTLREVALGGPDTASRAQIVWQVGLLPISTAQYPPATGLPEGKWDELAVDLHRRQPIPVMRVKAAERDDDDSDPCVVNVRSCYRGFENQLYRVEICRGGEAGTGDENATFVFSRNNGSDVLPVEAIEGNKVRLAQGWRDALCAIKAGDHVEIAGPETRLSAGPGQILRVLGYDPDDLTLTLSDPPEQPAAQVSDGVTMRHWHHVERHPNTGAPAIADDNALELTEGSWLTLEDGISVLFGEPRTVIRGRRLPRHDERYDNNLVEAAGDKIPASTDPAYYKSGDYWIFEARVELGDVVWPCQPDDPDEPAPQPPRGVERHYAPLAAITFDGNGKVTKTRDLRRTIKPVST